MKLIDLKVIHDALESAEVEFEALMQDKEWFVTEVVDKLADAKNRVEVAIEEEK